MKTKVYSILDTKVGFFSLPYFAPRDAAAVRTFSDSVNDPRPENGWHKHPEDYSLYLIGEYNDETGALTACLPQCLVTASSVMQVDGMSVESVVGKPN